MFELERFVADLRASLAERSRKAMKEFVAAAVADPAGLRRGIGASDQAGVQVLHRAADLTVLEIAWAPGQITLPHNHLLGAVIGMYDGREDNLYWRRLPNPDKYQIEAAGGAALGTGDVVVLGRDIIHSVINPLGRVSRAIHVYDGDFFAPGRSMWDAETLAEKPYDVATVSGGMMTRN